MKKKREQGLLAVEASLVLFFFIFFMLFVWNFAGVFAAQNAVSHASMQAVQTIGMDSMFKERFYSQSSDLYELTRSVNQLLDDLNGLLGTDTSGLTGHFDTFADSDQKENWVKNLIAYYLENASGEDASKYWGIDLNDLHVEVDKTAADAGSVKVKVRYKVKLQFAVFGFEEIEMTKNAECKLFGVSR